MKQGKKVCKTTAVQCYQCFSLRSLLFLASRAKWLIPKNNSYSGELLTAADRCKNTMNVDMMVLSYTVTQVWVNVTNV